MEEEEAKRRLDVFQSRASSLLDRSKKINSENELETLAKDLEKMTGDLNLEMKIIQTEILKRLG